ncbi:MAG TPA: PadR family transcriptional regulator [Spongiibacteraceae bacterium]|nr:PadR family transcriptional regulator [Spongiibacteraceae bacterium]
MRFTHEHHQQRHHRDHHARHAGAHPHEFNPRGHGPRRFGHDWSEESGEGRGRRQRLFDGTELRLVLLKLIADEPRHGYDLIRAIEELTAGNYAPSPGVVYPALSLLQDLSHIEGAESAGSRKAFTVTPEGTAELAAKAEKVAELFARLAALAAAREQTDRGPIRRAMENLGTVLRQRLGHGNVEKDTLHAIAAILDEAAQRIERL